MAERLSFRVHPNSTAARKWKRTTWTTTRNVYAEAAIARRAGDDVRARALLRAAARSSTPDLHCG